MSDARPFEFNLSTRIYFGVGVRRDVGKTARQFGSRVALVTGEHSFEGSPFRSEIEDALEAGGADIVVRLHAAGEPTLAAAVAAGEAVRLARAELLIGIGGGSVLDLTKAAAVGAAGGDLRALSGGERYGGPALPTVAMPTTAGSGAEASRGAILLDEEARRKRGIRGSAVAPSVALVDPELVTSCPPVVTARAGFDALAHAIETSLSRAATPFVQLLSREALGRLLTSVPRALHHPHDVGIRADASYASLLMGINLANSTTCLPHRLQYPLGALTRTEHARGVAALTPAWLSRMVEHAPAQLAALAPAAGDRTGDVRRDAASLVNAVLDFIAGLELRVRLRDLGVDRADLPRLAAMVEGPVENDPGPSDRQAILQLYEASY